MNLAISNIAWKPKNRKKIYKFLSKEKISGIELKNLPKNLPIKLPCTECVWNMTLDLSSFLIILNKENNILIGFLPTQIVLIPSFSNWFLKGQAFANK